MPLGIMGGGNGHGRNGGQYFQSHFTKRCKVLGMCSSLNSFFFFLFFGGGGEGWA